MAGLNLSINRKNNPNPNYMNKYQQQQPHNGIASTRAPYAQHHHHHQHMGSGEFELSTDTDDESLNGEPDSSMNVLPPWEMAVEALRETRPKERERVLHLLQRLLHDNQQYRYTNLKLNELLQKREAQIRELSEQLQHYRILLEQQQEQQQKQLPHLMEQEQADNLKSRMHEEISVSSQNTELRVPLKKSLRREPEMLLINPVSLSWNENIIESKRDIVENINDEKPIVARIKTKTEETENAEVKDEYNSDKLEKKRELDEKPEENENVMQVVVEADEEEKEEEVEEEKESKQQVMTAALETKLCTEDDSTTESENDSEKSNLSIATLHGKATTVTSAESQAKEEIKQLNESEINVVQNTKLSLCTNQIMSEETERGDHVLGENDGMDYEEAADEAEDEDDDEGEKEVKTEKVQKIAEKSADTALATATTISSASAITAEQLFDSSNSSDSIVIKQAQMCASNVVAQMTDASEAVAVKAESSNEMAAKAVSNVEIVAEENIGVVSETSATAVKTEVKAAKRSKETTSVLIKKKKKKKERKERKEKRRAAAALAAAAVVSARKYELVANGEVSILRPPMATKASKKHTPMTTNCEQQQQQQQIKQEQLI